MENVVIEVERFKANDGAVFETEPQCAAHEARLALREKGRARMATMKGIELTRLRRFVIINEMLEPDDTELIEQIAEDIMGQGEEVPKRYFVCCSESERTSFSTLAEFEEWLNSCNVDGTALDDCEIDDAMACLYDLDSEESNNFLNLDYDVVRTVVIDKGGRK